MVCAHAFSEVNMRENRERKKRNKKSVALYIKVGFLFIRISHQIGSHTKKWEINDKH